MFRTIFFFELWQWLRRWPFYGYAAFFFLMALVSMAGAAGAFGAGEGQVAAAAAEPANAPLSLYQFALFFNKLLLLLLPVFIGTTLHKDFQSNAHALLYAYPMAKRAYLLAKFSSGFMLVALVAALVLLGLFCGTLIPGIPSQNLWSGTLLPYGQLYVLYLLPNLLVFGVLVFAVVLLSRNIYAAFIVVLLMGLLREAAMRAMGGTSAGLLLDPLGDAPTQAVVRYWTPEEALVHGLPFSGALLANRLFWLVLGAIGFAAAYRSFSFSQVAALWGWPARLTKTSLRSLPKLEGGLQVRQRQGALLRVVLPPIVFNHALGAQARTAFQLAWLDLQFIAQSGAFVSIVLAGIVFVGVLLFQINPQTDTKVLPATWFILGFPVFFFSFLIQLLTFLYAGVLVQRARAARMADLVAVTPVHNLTLWASKFLALVGMQSLLLSLLLLLGIGTQLYQGYSDIQLGQYMFSLFVFHGIGFVVWALMALFVQTLVASVYPALFLLILLWLGVGELPSLGISEHVFRFNDVPHSDSFLYASDLSPRGFGQRVYFLYRSYWLLFGGLLACVSLLFWSREHSLGWRERLAFARRRFGLAQAVTIGLLSVGVLAFGAWGYRMERAEAQTLPRNEQKLLADFQARFARLAHVPQPRIAALSVALDFYPEQQRFRAKGHFVLHNRNAVPVDTLLLKCSFDEYTEVWFDDPVQKLIVDTIFHFTVYPLHPPLAPGDSMLLHFDIRNKANTLLTQNSNVLDNGTFLKSDIFPSIGYFAETEPSLPEAASTLRHYQRSDEDGIRYEAVLSTSIGQTAVTAGSPLRSWTKDDRHYVHYKMPQPVKFVLGFHSGEFNVMRERYRGVELAIFHHPTHRACLASMMAGLKASLDFSTQHFGAYPYGQISIVEFVRAEGSYATTSGNVISMSELRFIHNTDAEFLDLPFYVAAHELAHQWWGNQVIPAEAFGATVLTESIAEYVSVKVYEQAFGRAKALRFLEQQRVRYRQGRAEAGSASTPDVPLYLASAEQTYLTYGKGALAFYTLQEAWGEAELLAALGTFLQQHRGGPPYPTSLDLLEHLKTAAPAHLHGLIGHLLERPEPELTLKPVEAWLGP
ncbi:MAG: hypothetical protein GC205_04050 [Bacteroidetes bacterium]|nr:hypothetical protein [Bacteroidota bacterium]